MTTLTLRDALEESQSLLVSTLHERRPNHEIEAQIRMNRIALESQPELPEPIAEVTCTIVHGWGTRWIAKDGERNIPPLGTKLYTAAQLQQAKPVGGESVLVDGTAYDIPAPVAAELLRLMQAVDSKDELLKKANEIIKPFAEISRWLTGGKE